MKRRIKPACPRRPFFAAFLNAQRQAFLEAFFAGEAFNGGDVAHVLVLLERLHTLPELDIRCFRQNHHPVDQPEDFVGLGFVVPLGQQLTGQLDLVLQPFGQPATGRVCFKYATPTSTMGLSLSA